MRATRDGSRRAYAALWKRHSVSALKYAKTLTASDADDVVSEAFLKVYAAIKAGHGPEEDFRYYLRSAVRNTYVSMVRSHRTAPAGEAIEDVIGDRGADIASVQSFDGSVTARAFLSLPTRWQEVLWYTEVEGLSREHTATLLGMNANAVSALSFRAREALRTAWLQQHISTQSDLDRGCEAVTPLLGAYSRRGLSRRDRLRVEHHVNGCAHCTSVVGELAELLTPGRLALILLPIALAGGGFAAYATKFGGGSAVAASAIATPTVAVAVGGGGAATGAAALSVVGQVAACAIVATMILPPAQMFFEATHPAHAVSHSTANADAGHGLDALAVADLIDASTADATHDSSDDPATPPDAVTDAELDALESPRAAPEHPRGDEKSAPEARPKSPQGGGTGNREDADAKKNETSKPADVTNANPAAKATEKSPSVPGASGNATEKSRSASSGGPSATAPAPEKSSTEPTVNAGAAESAPASAAPAPAAPAPAPPAPAAPAPAAPTAAAATLVEAPVIADGVEAAPAGD